MGGGGTPYTQNNFSFFLFFLQILPHYVDIFVWIFQSLLHGLVPIKKFFLKMPSQHLLGLLPIRKFNFRAKLLFVLQVSVCTNYSWSVVFTPILSVLRRNKKKNCDKGDHWTFQKHADNNTDKSALYQTCRKSRLVWERQHRKNGFSGNCWSKLHI